MADATAGEEVRTSKPSKLPLIIGLALALIGGGGGFFAVNQGLILAPESSGANTDSVKPATEAGTRKLTDFAFVPMEPLTISLTPGSNFRHLRFRGELEVASGYAGEVETLLPRIIDVLNTYLRALETSDIEQAASLTRLRAQMLRRVQIVAGPGRINDLLIMEFVLN